MSVIVCPVCHGDLDGVVCVVCHRSYSYSGKLPPRLPGDYDFVTDFTPDPPPDADVRENWSLWEKLQDNGLDAYVHAPDGNCSLNSRGIVRSFRRFVRLGWGNRVLDVGCGPSGRPGYLGRVPNTLVYGIDPLQPSSPLSDVFFVRGIGEYLPFRSGYFDVIILASSLDHTLSPRRVVAEVGRCLKPGGRVCVWAWSPKAARAPRFSRLRHAFANARGKVVPLVPPAWVKIKESADTPPGAIDCYHFHHESENDLCSWFSEVDLVLSHRKTYRSGNLFLEFVTKT